MTGLRFERLLLTGAAGALGGTLRTRLSGLCRILRVTDKADLGAVAEGEEAIQADLADHDAVDALVAQCDAIVHFGGIMREDWDAILRANVVGLYNLYEAARRHGVKRVVYASSNHATGFYGTNQVITPLDPVRPDTLYGLSKTWGENIARLYFDRYGIETACLRIGSAFAEPRDLRMLATWLSYDDLERLVHACLTAPRVGHTIMYGVSRNSRCFWDNRSAGYIGFSPQDSADDYREALEARLPPLSSTEDGAVYQGGPFVRAQPSRTG